MLALAIRTRQAGKITWGTPLVVVVVLLIGYFVYVWAPPWARNRRVSAAMREGGYASWRIKDEEVKKIILDRTDRMYPPRSDPEGKIPSITTDMIFIERDKEEETITISVSYEVNVDYPIIDRRTAVTFDNVVVGDTRNPNKEEPNELLDWLTK